ncbi:MAG TPA: dephospho-CoA kinase [Alphaproteobacteria bacterium]|nr:dephospho-CoA kinase [Alphaproteobacteria bacterium]
MAGRTRVIGLTGSIGMGKSTAAAMLRRLHVPVFEADVFAHTLLEPGGAAVAAVTEAFPDAVENGTISRPALARSVFGDEEALARLEGILHPLVRAGEKYFIARQNLRRKRLAALEIPLLFETGAEELCDAVVVLTAPHFVQEARVMSRPGMTKERLDAVRARQMPEAEKCARADYVIPTGLGLRRTFIGLKAVVRDLT